VGSAVCAGTVRVTGAEPASQSLRAHHVLKLYRPLGASATNHTEQVCFTTRCKGRVGSLWCQPGSAGVAVAERQHGRGVPPHWQRGSPS
jgi:hypothetical protein